MGKRARFIGFQFRPGDGDTDLQEMQAWQIIWAAARVPGTVGSLVDVFQQKGD